ncbi:MAG TPA: lytic murein transglycosylase [Solirubrobacterales bacterium]|jgi:murein DD-endopeptidase MepM/ murein hydrolase activator NlpD|nr:lytic murein transglycosylase [Solirubrobacterales bacterium]
MRRQFLLAIALAGLGVAVTAGTVRAADPVLGVGSDGVSVNLPGGANLDLDVLPACSNQTDDDGDGLKDLADPGCNGPVDNEESNPPPAPPGVDDGGTAPPPGTTPPPGTVPGGGGSAGGDNGVTGQGPTGGHGAGDRGPGGGGGESEAGGGDRQPMEEPPTRNPDGTPTDANPSLTIADFGPAPIGVPNFVIDQFTIPPFLLPLYQACGTQYGIPWQILASINRIETAFGTNLNVSTAGAVGWMQFLPSTWKAYGVDANEDGRKDPYNPLDAICAAARYLRAAGGEEDLQRAIFAYNHADWYVDEVLLYARQYGRLPDDLVGSLTGLTEGARFPVAASARYADDISERQALKRSKPGKRQAGNVADVVSSSPTRRGINIYTRDGAPVVAVNDGVIKEIGHSKRLGKYLVLQDAYGNRFTYAELGRVSDVYPVPKRDRLSADDFKLVSPKDDREPSAPASEGANRGRVARAAASDGPVNTEDARERLYAYPERPNNVDRADLSGQLNDLLAERFPGYESFKSYFSGVLRFDRKTMEMRPLKEGSKVIAGTVLGRVGKTSKLAPHLHFAIQPAGRGAPRIDPKPILDGWKLLEATAIYRAAGEDPFSGDATTGQVLLMSKPQLVRRVLADPRVQLYSCGREDVRTGQIDRRILALLEYLAERGFRLTVTSLKCGHSVYTSSGSISHHSSGNAVDIAQINGIPVLGNQGRASITEALVRDVMQLQGSMAPDQIISLMDFGANTFAMADHADHVHVGYQPLYGPGTGSATKQFSEILKADQWQRLIERIAEIDNPKVPTSPSRFALPSKDGRNSGGGDRASSAHVGE